LQSIDDINMTNISTDIARQIQSAMQRPVGTLQFRYTSPEVFGLGSEARVVIQIVSGGHVFRLERSSDRILSFFYSSPGTGTRVASISLGTTPPFESALMWFVWSPEEVRLTCGPLVEGGTLLSAEGTVSSKQFRVGEDGSVITVGDVGAEVMGARIVEAGRPILQPTAIGAWNETLKGIEILRTAKSTDGFLFESVSCQYDLGTLGYRNGSVCQHENLGIRDGGHHA
jgi:hypothetical protein